MKVAPPECEHNNYTNEYYMYSAGHGYNIGIFSEREAVNAIERAERLVNEIEEIIKEENGEVL